MPIDLSTLPLSEMSGATSPHVSPTIASLREEDKPAPSPACSNCPRADWLVVSQGLKCYCTAYRRISWEKPLDPQWGAVMACDGREAAIVLLNARP